MSRSVGRPSPSALFRPNNRSLRTDNPVCRGKPSGFTLIELLVVISIIAILIGLLFPAFKGVQDQAKKVQAKNDVTQIVTAITAFYTEYGQYPCGSQGGSDSQDFFTANDTDRKNIFDALRVPFPSSPPALNPRGIVYFQPPIVKNDTAGQRKSGVAGDGIVYDPWGTGYRIKMDNNYNGLLVNPYAKNAGFPTINAGVMVWSFGKDGQSQSDPGPASDKNTGTNADDVISWQ
jgi:prepilin-type N-terminal cleavage/methylation domain-containing protein